MSRSSAVVTYLWSATSSGFACTSTSALQVMHFLLLTRRSEISGGRQFDLECGPSGEQQQSAAVQSIVQLSLAGSATVMALHEKLTG